MRIRWWAAPGAIAAVALLAACGSSGGGSTSSGSGSSSAAAPASSPAAAASPLPSPVSTSATGITTATTSAGTFLVTAQGAAIYLFASDTPGKSTCNAQCLSFWPALIGTPTAAAGSGLTGTFGTIKGTGGITQATYDGHPLYLFVADKKANDPTGNGVTASGAKWWAITPSGADLPKAAAAPAKSSAATTSGGGGGGYGY
jgi:predicted lipoprotein with Yx(FWY)xxD motif